MRKIIWTILPAFALILALTLVSWKNIQKESDIPSEVASILENSCYACHTTGAKAEDAVKAVDFKKWSAYKKTKKVGILNDIQEVVKEGMMPPGKFVDRNPEKALSDEDREVIVKWTKKETAKLMGDEDEDDDEG
ncbi:heme-binding domain-containing protein [Bacteroidota bacterium]